MKSQKIGIFFDLISNLSIVHYTSLNHILPFYHSSHLIQNGSYAFQDVIQAILTQTFLVVLVVVATVVVMVMGIEMTLSTTIVLVISMVVLEKGTAMTMTIITMEEMMIKKEK